MLAEDEEGLAVAGAGLYVAPTMTLPLPEGVSYADPRLTLTPKAVEMAKARLLDAGEPVYGLRLGAIIAFLVIEWVGFSQLGLGYLKKFFNFDFSHGVIFVGRSAADRNTEIVEAVTQIKGGHLQ